jgi:hypothetical protein
LPTKNPVRSFLLPHTCHTPHLSHYPSSDHPSIWWRVKIRNLLSGTLLQPPLIPCLSHPNILTSSLISNILSQCSPLDDHDEFYWYSLFVHAGKLAL